MKVTENEDGKGFLIEWDANDPVESVFNDWKEEHFIRVIMEYAQGVIEEYGEEDLDTSS